MSNALVIAVACGVAITIAATLTVQGINSNTEAIDDILVAMLNAKGE